MLNKEQSDREAAISDLESRMNQQNDDRIQEIDDLRTKLMRENQFLRNLANKSNSVYFDAYRTKAYDGGGEENLTFQVRSATELFLIPWIHWVRHMVSNT